MTSSATSAIRVRSTREATITGPDIMTDHDDIRSRPQRQAVPRMLIFLGTITAIAIAIMLWFVMKW